MSCWWCSKSALTSSQAVIKHTAACSIDVLVAVNHSWSLLSVAARVARKHTYLARDGGNNCSVAGTRQLAIVERCRNMFETVFQSSRLYCYNKEQNKTNQCCVRTFRKTKVKQSFISCAKYVNLLQAFLWTMLRLFRWFFKRKDSIKVVFSTLCAPGFSLGRGGL